jgi:hypothetical protein
MEEVVKNLMIPISNQIKKIIHQEVVGPVYNENGQVWLIAIRVMKPICGSFEIRLTKPQNEELPILSIEIYCEKSNKRMREIFIKIIRLLDNKIYKLNSSENFIGLHWPVKINSKNEAEIDFVKFSRLIPRIFMILKDLGLFELKSYESIVNTTADNFFRSNSKKIEDKKIKSFLIRKDCPVIYPAEKKYFYFN